MASANTGWFDAGSNPTVETYCECNLSRSQNTVTVNWTVIMRLTSSYSYLGTGSLDVYCNCSGGGSGSGTIKDHNESWSGTEEHSFSGSFTFQNSSATEQTFQVNFSSDSDYFSSSGIFDVSVNCSVEGLSIARINSFTGNDITGNFKVDFTSYSNQFNYKLRLSIPSVVAVQIFNNYSNQNNVKFDNAALQILQNNMSRTNQVQIGAVIETWSGNTKIGESSELINTCIWYRSRIKVNGIWRKAIPFIKINGTWKQAIPFYKINGSWKRGI